MPTTKPKPKPIKGVTNAYPLTRLSQMFGANRETMRKRLELVRPADPTGKGKYALSQVLDAYVAWERMQSATISPQSQSLDDLDANYERARKDREIANKYELANAQRRGELLEASDVEKKWSGVIHAIRTKLLAMPQKYAPVVVPIDVLMVAEKELTVAVHECLDALGGDEE